MHHLFNLLFGCWHRNTSFPITVRNPAPRRTAADCHSGASRLTGTYVVCLDCGREFPYDLQQMKIIRKPTQVVTAVQPQSNPLQARFLNEASPRFR